MKQKTKSNLRVVPILHDSLGSCWAIKDGMRVLGTFISKVSAETRKSQIEQNNLENFSFSGTVSKQFEINNLL